MVQRVSLIEHLRSNHPATWSLLKLAATQGLASIDDSADTVSLDSELGQRHQRLHFRAQLRPDPTSFQVASGAREASGEIKRSHPPNNH